MLEAAHTKQKNNNKFPLSDEKLHAVMLSNIAICVSYQSICKHDQGKKNNNQNKPWPFSMPFLTLSFQSKSL